MKFFNSSKWAFEQDTNISSNMVKDKVKIRLINPLSLATQSIFQQTVIKLTTLKNFYNVQKLKAYLV
jgi:hypothetical protein